MNAILRIVRRTVRAAVALSAVLGVTLAAPAQAQIAYRAASSATLSGSGALYQSGAGAAASAASGDVAPALPSGWQPKDLLLALVESRDNVPATLPSGWTLLNEGGGAGGAHRAAIFWKWAAAGDAAPTVSHAGGGRIIAQVHYFRGVDRVNPFDAANSFTYSSTDLTTEAGEITTATSGSMLLLTAQIGAQSTSFTPPSGWQLLASGSSGVAGDGVSIAVYLKLYQAAGTYPTASVSHSESAESHGAQLALRAGRTLPVAKPAGTAANDVMLASVLVYGQYPSSTPPAGWTLVRRISGAVFSVLEIYVRTAGAAEPAQYTWNLGASAHGPAAVSVQSFSGVDPANPVHVENGQSTASGLTHATPDISTTLANTMLVSAHGYRSSGTWSPPAGMTETTDIAAFFVPDGGGVSLETNYALQAAAGATGAKTATASGNADGGQAHLLALRPAPPTAQVYYIHTDHLNTPRQIYDGDLVQPKLVWRWDQTEPFGVNVPDENPSALGAFEFPLRHSNYYADKETNQHYAMLRDCYDSALGRFCQSDPIGLRGGINTYGFVAADPLRSIDPSGLVKWTGSGRSFSYRVYTRDEYELESECKCGIKVKVKVVVDSFGKGFGAAAYQASADFEDQFACPNPMAFAGPALGFNFVAGLGFGVSYNRVQLGVVKSNGWTAAEAYGFAIGPGAGRSEVTDIRSGACSCSPGSKR